MKFLHISDLHLDPMRDGRTSRNIRNSLVPYLKEQNILADNLIITGDFRYAPTQRKEQVDINIVVEYIRSIAGAIGIKDINHIHIVPGNHDLDRKNDKDRIERIRKKYDPANGRFSDDDLSYLLSKFEYFNLLCNSLYGSQNYWTGDVLHTYRVVDDFVFLYLNTAIMHNGDVDRIRHRLIIGNDLFDILLDEIEKKYPNYPIIVLAHHSPDLFEKKEKEAVEDILQNHPKAILYLCGDAHDFWPRNVNNHLEVTMGCLKQESGAEAVFMYADTVTQEFSVHHWIKAWEPYAAFNESIQKKLSNVCVSSLNPLSTTTSSLSENVDIEMAFKKDGVLKNEKDVNNSIIRWLVDDKSYQLHIRTIMDDLEKIQAKYTKLLQKVHDNTALNDFEEDKILSYKEQCEHYTQFQAKAKTACELFLSDKSIHRCCNLLDYKDFVYILKNIVFEVYNIHLFAAHKGNHNIDFYYPSECTEKYSFKAEITLDISSRNPLLFQMHFGGAKLNDLIYTIEDRELWDILVKFYIMIANEACNNPTILEDKQALNLLNYQIGNG